MKLLFVAGLCALLAPFAYAANLTGHWIVTFQADGATRETSLFLKAEGDLLTGYMSSNQGNEAIHDGKISGDAFSFVIVVDRFGEERKLEFTGTVKDDTLTMQYPHPPDRPGRHIELKRVSSEAPGPMPPAPPKISLARSRASPLQRPGENAPDGLE